MRELIRDPEPAGFMDLGGKESHRKFVHPKIRKPVGKSGYFGDDAKHYQEKVVYRAIEEAKQ